MNNLNSYIKFLSRNKLYTFINVFGLSLSLMFVILIANHAIEEYSTDNFQENADQIYLLGDKNATSTGYRIGGLLKSRYPEIEKTCGVVTVEMIVEALNVESKGSCIATDYSFFDMFSFELKQGDKNNVLVSQNSIVISERFAKKVFGDLDPIGQNLQFRDTLSYTVSGVIENIENSILPYTDMIIHIENMKYFNPKIIAEGFDSAGGTIMFLQVIKGSDISLMADDMLEYFKTFFWIYEDNIRKDVTLTPMNEMYFSKLSSTSSTLNKGDKELTSMLLIVGVLILVFAILNYINLTVAQTSFRAKEVSMRRLLGASKYAIFIIMILESMLLCVVAFLIGLVLAISVEPYANDLIGGNISIGDNLSAMWIISYIGLVVSLGVVSGIFPAIVISQFKPIDVVRGSFTLKSKMTYSKVFITIQAMITTVLIGCSITVLGQFEHLLNADLGYNQKGIINVSTWGGSFKNENQMKLFRERLKALPIVENVGFTAGMPNSRNSQMMNVSGVNEMVSFQYCKRDSTAMKILGIEILEDRQIAEEGVWLNETAIRIIGIDKNTKSFKNDSGTEYIIKGVVKDYMLGDVVTQTKTLPLLLDIEEDIEPWNILVEVNGDFISSFKEVEKMFKDVANGAGFNAQFVDQQVAERYESQKKTSTIMMIFTLIAIIISSLGLLAMSAYFIQQRSKEIAVRKVFGSTTPQVLKKLIWQFLRLVIIAFVIACPIIWYAMSEWLQDFSYRIELSVWIFILAGLFTLSISFVTVFWQSSIAANANPVDSIKR